MQIGQEMLVIEDPLKAIGKKQTDVARSNTEGEYRAKTNAICELVWLRNLLQELKFCEICLMELACDNQSTLHLSSNPIFYERTKHIEVDCHFIREKILSRHHQELFYQI